METKSFCNVVVLQTVLEEVRNRSPSIYQRIRALQNRPEKRFFVFSNEHHRECFAGNNKSETAEIAVVESDNDRNDRAIRLAASWYQKAFEFNLHHRSSYCNFTYKMILGIVKRL